MTDQEEFDAWFDLHYRRTVVPRLVVVVAFDAWRSSREALIAASGAPVEIKVIGEAKS
ncbi:hypothetical protein [Paraburkholderia caledonica]|jgi:hypothetical protein|uniref:hypothetical protein n=1 Tax=Paraburkholderia caledonica TaxID=134536 RepID=UPI0038B87967